VADVKTKFAMLQEYAAITRNQLEEMLTWNPPNPEAVMFISNQLKFLEQEIAIKKEKI
jgi:hypothetical protein